MMREQKLDQALRAILASVTSDDSGGYCSICGVCHDEGAERCWGTKARAALALEPASPRDDLCACGHKKDDHGVQPVDEILRARWNAPPNCRRIGCQCPQFSQMAPRPAPPPAPSTVKPAGCTETNPCHQPALRWVHSVRCRMAYPPPAPSEECGECHDRGGNGRCSRCDEVLCEGPCEACGRATKEQP